MPKVELQKTFHVPLDKVIEYFGNYDVYNKQHVRSDTTTTVVSRGDNEVVVESKQEVQGRIVNSSSKTVYRLPRGIEMETLSGPAKGSWQKVTFESVSEGTKVIYAADFKVTFGGLAGKALRTVSGKMMKKMMRESLEGVAEADRKYLEGELPEASDAA